MLFERLIIFTLFVCAFFMAGIPLIKLIVQFVKSRFFTTNPVEEARKRLSYIEAEVEASKLNKRADELIDNLYSETLNKEDLDLYSQEVDVEELESDKTIVIRRK